MKTVIIGVSDAQPCAFQKGRSSKGAGAKLAICIGGEGGQVRVWPGFEKVGYWGTFSGNLLMQSPSSAHGRTP